MELLVNTALLAGEEVTVLLLRTRSALEVITHNCFLLFLISSAK